MGNDKKVKQKVPLYKVNDRILHEKLTQLFRVLTFAELQILHISWL